MISWVVRALQFDFADSSAFWMLLFLIIWSIATISVAGLFLFKLKTNFFCDRSLIGFSSGTRTRMHQWASWLVKNLLRGNDE
jgi:hypothetical protein